MGHKPPIFFFTLKMKFLKKREEYKVVYNKTQAIKELKEDARVGNIKSSFKALIIITKPIIPHGFKGDKIFVYPVGTYEIILKERRGKISVKINRREGILDNGDGYKRVIHQHIRTNWEDDHGEAGICWGNREKAIKEMERNKDWLWIAKTCLDILNDFEETGIKRALLFQADYMKKDKKAIKVLEKMFTKAKKKRWEYVRRWR